MTTLSLHDALPLSVSKRKEYSVDICSDACVGRWEKCISTYSSYIYDRESGNGRVHHAWSHIRQIDGIVNPSRIQSLCGKCLYGDWHILQIFLTFLRSNDNFRNQATLTIVSSRYFW